MFENWSRKMSGLAAIVITLTVVCVIVGWLRQSSFPTLAEWASFLKELALTYGIVIAIAAAKSVATDLAHRPKTPSA